MFHLYCFLMLGDIIHLHKVNSQLIHPYIIEVPLLIPAGELFSVKNEMPSSKAPLRPCFQVKCVVEKSMGGWSFLFDLTVFFNGLTFGCLVTLWCGDGMAWGGY